MIVVGQGSKGHDVDERTDRTERPPGTNAVVGRAAQAAPLKSVGDRARVLLVAENGEAGGIGRYCVDLAGGIGERGQAQVVCLCPEPCDERCWLARECVRQSIVLHRIDMPRRAWTHGLSACSMSGVARANR